MNRTTVLSTHMVTGQLFAGKMNINSHRCLYKLKKKKNKMIECVSFLRECTKKIDKNSITLARVNWDGDRCIDSSIFRKF